MKLYLDGECIYNTEVPRFNSKMWVFKETTDIDPFITTYSDFIILNDNSSYNLKTYYVDANLDYWKKEKCFFTQKAANEERQLRLNRKWNVDNE